MIEGDKLYGKENAEEKKMAWMDCIFKYCRSAWEGDIWADSGKWWRYSLVGICNLTVT